MVEFELAHDCLTVSHDGVRAFSLADIESITGIGKSTKKDDETQIGKFGVGFKAVFAYTTRPEIHSGEYSFAISDLFIPELTEDGRRAGRTTFSFPFDRPEKPADLARAEVERGLRELDEKTLLFLNSIREITYELPDGDIGFVKRTDIDNVTIKVEVSQDDGFVESNWLRLVGPASTPHNGHSPLTVAAAFKLEPKETGRGRSSVNLAGAAEVPGHCPTRGRRRLDLLSRSQGDLETPVPHPRTVCLDRCSRLSSGHARQRHSWSPTSAT